jgi:hypothetical protein
MGWAPLITARGQGPSGRWASLVGKSNQQFSIRPKQNLFLDFVLSLINFVENTINIYVFK